MGLAFKPDWACKDILAGVHKMSLTNTMREIHSIGLAAR